MNSYLLQIKLFFIKVDLLEKLVEPVMILEGKKSAGLVAFIIPIWQLLVCFCRKLKHESDKNLVIKLVNMIVT